MATVTDLGLDVGNITDLAGAIDDDEDFIVALVEEHQVVDDAAVVVEQQAVALPAFGQIDHIHRHQGFEGAGGVGAFKAQLPHVRDIEQTGGPARVQVLGHQALVVLHRHAVAGKGDHARAHADVHVVQGGGEQIVSGGGHDVLRGNACSMAEAMGCPRCPLYLRDSPGLIRTDCGLLLRWTCVATGLSPVGNVRFPGRLPVLCA